MSRWIRVLLIVAVGSFLMLLVIGFFTIIAGYGNPQPTVVTPTPLEQQDNGVTPEPSPTLTTTPTASPTPSPSPSATPTLEPTKTPTMTPTATLTPEPSATPVTPVLVLPDVTLPIIYATPVVSSFLPQPTPMPFIEQPPGTVNILLLGSDRRPGEEIGRTDVLMIASIYPDLPSVSLVSIPRDYYAWIPSWGLDKINTAFVRAKRTGYPGGGVALIKDTIAYNFGVPIHFFAMVDFNSYQSIVDAVGGVDLVIECPFHDTYPDAESPTGQTDIDMEPGVHHLDGKYALWYVRSRWNTSDFDRHRRQQQVLRAVLHKALTENLVARIPDFWSVYKDSVLTDMGLTDILALVPAAVRLDERDIKSRFIRGTPLIKSMTSPTGAYVLVPDYELLYEFMKEAAQPQVTSRAAQRAYRVIVLNGTGNSGWGQVAAYRLGLEGLAVVTIEDIAWQSRTSLIDFTTTRKGSPLERIMQLYKLTQLDVTFNPNDDSPSEFTVQLGSNYNPCSGTNTAYWRGTPTPSPTPSAP